MIKTCLLIKILIPSIILLFAEPVYCEEDDVNSSGEISYKVYLTKRGDTLNEIAKKIDIYGDELKWPFIYILNKSEPGLKKEKDIPVENKILPAGVNLAILLTRETKKYALYDSLCKKFNWVINVSSDVKKDEISRLALNLMDSNYFVYLTEFDHENIKYTRLRVGFYPSREDADSDAGILKDKLNLPGIWVVRAGPEEVYEFVGFYGLLSQQGRAVYSKN